MIIKHFTSAMRRFMEFDGRSRRSEFWSFVLIYSIIVSMATNLDHNLLGHGTEFFRKLVKFGLFLPLAAVSFRRLQDMGRSGWWSCIAFTGIGMFVLLFWWVQDSYDGPNEYGLSPKDSSYQPPFEPRDDDFV